MKKRIGWIFFCVITGAAVLLTAHFGSRAVTVMVENAPIDRDVCIVIDAGHGGVDGGATSCSGILESTYNLNIALRLNDLFHLLGIDTVMIRTTDISVYTKGETIAQKKVSDLKERVRIVMDTENALLLSIHQNNFSDGRYSGAQVFYPKTEGSELLAKQLQRDFVSILNPGSKRQVKKADGIYLMEHIDCPGVLIECGFLSNVQEEALLRSKEYQQKLCCIIAAATQKYIEGNSNT